MPDYILTQCNLDSMSAFTGLLYQQMSIIFGNYIEQLHGYCMFILEPFLQVFNLVGGTISCMCEKCHLYFSSAYTIQPVLDFEIMR